MKRTHNLGLMRISYVMNMVSIMSVWFYCLTHWGRDQMAAIILLEYSHLPLIFPPAIDIIPTLLAVVYSNGKYTN